MKNKIAYYIASVRLFGKQFVNWYFRNLRLTEQGRRMIAYLYKIIKEPSYEPITYAEQMFEEAIQEVVKDANLSRRHAAYKIFVALVERENPFYKNKKEI